MKNAFKFQQAVVLGRFAAAPSSPSEGAIYYDTVLKTLRFFDGTSWENVAAGEITPEFSDLVFRIQNDTDPTKQIAFDASAISAASTSTISVPDYDVNLADIAAKANSLDVMLLTGSQSMSGNMSLGGNKITNLATPTDNTDAATKQYVDTVAGGGANTSLSNLDSTAINESLLPDTNDTLNLGDAAIYWQEAFVSTVSAAQLWSKAEGVAIVDLDARQIKTISGATAIDWSVTGAVSFGGSKLSSVDEPSASDDAATKNYVDVGLSGKLSLSGGVLTGNLSLSGNKVTNLATPTDPLDAANKQYVDNALTGLDFQPDVLDIQVDNTLDPDPATTGDRYIITNAANLNANFGTIAGLNDNDIVQYDGTEWFVAYDVTTSGPGALVWDRASATFYRWDGTSWDQFGGLEGITAGVGLTKTGNVLDVNLGAGIAELPTDEIGIDVRTDGALFLTVDGSTPSTATGAQLSILLDGSSLSKSVSGLKVAALGIDNSHIATAANIDRSKIAAGTATNVLFNDGSGKISESADFTYSSSTGLTVTTSSSSKILTLNSSYGASVLEINKNGGGPSINVIQTSGGNAGGLLRFDRYRTNATTVLQAGDEVMALQAWGSNGNNSTGQVGAINVSVDTAAASGSLPSAKILMNIYESGSLNSFVKIASSGSTFRRAIRIGASATSADTVTDFAEIMKVGQTLAAGTSTPTATGISITASAYRGGVLSYIAREASTLATRVGKLYIAHDGTNISFADTGAETAVIGTDFTLSADISGGAVRILFTGTGANTVSLTGTLELLV